MNDKDKKSERREKKRRYVFNFMRRGISGKSLRKVSRCVVGG